MRQSSVNHAQSDMSYFSNERKPLLNFSETQERASLIDTDFEEESMSPRKRTGRKRRGRKSSGKGDKRKGIRLNKGKIRIRLPGYEGLQFVTASELVRHIPLSKLKAAAKKVLRKAGVSKKRKGKRRGRKRVGRRKRKQ